MDTKLRKTRKFSWVAVFLSVFLPAVCLVSLYPMMSDLAEKKIQEFKEKQENVINDEYLLESQYFNYAVESSYCLYGRILEEITGQRVFFGVLEEYGWINDYYEFISSNHYYVEYGSGENVWTERNAEDYSAFLDIEKSSEAIEKYKSQGMIAYFVLEYDSYGKVTRVDNWSKYPLDSERGVYFEVNESIKKYKNNAIYYQNDLYDGILDSNMDRYQVEPKNFRCVFVLYEDTPFIYPVHELGYWSLESVYFEMGAVWIVIALAMLVAFLALVLPFIKPIGTGWEKLFCIPFEFVFVVLAGAIGGFALMYMAMCHTNMSFLAEHFSDDMVEFMGGNIGVDGLFGILIVLSVICWTLCFLMEYIVFASLRQFCCAPKTYLKEKVLGIVLIRWMWGKCKKICEEVSQIDIKDKLEQSIVKIVLGNSLALGVLILFWLFVVKVFNASQFGAFLFGMICLGMYAFGLFVLLRRYGQRIQYQYKSVIGASHQMAEGNLKIKLDEDLGIFQPLGNELQKVQSGFSKAVVEEAKSQNMKTELITNISHDLKTPLTAIITYADLLKQENISEEEKKSYIQTIEQKSNRLKSLIEDLFEVSKANSGNIKLNLQQVDVVSLLKQIHFEMEEEMEKSNLTFRWNLPEEKVVLNLDSQRTYRVFENLLTNILKYAMPYTRAYVDVLLLDKKVIIVFRNVSAAELDFDVTRLSERFVRGDVSRNTQGHGLGLSIVKSFVEIQKGTFKIDVDGDLFKVTIAWDIEA